MLFTVRIIVLTRSFDHRTGGGQRLQPFFFFWNKKPRLVSIHAESTGVTGVFEIRPVLEGSGRDADPCQRQTAGSARLIEKTIAFSEQAGGRVSNPSSASSAKPQSRCAAATACESSAQAVGAERSCRS